MFVRQGSVPFVRLFKRETTLFVGESTALETNPLGPLWNRCYHDAL